MNGVQQITAVHDIALITFNKAPAKIREDYPSIKPMVSSGNCKISLFGEEMREQYGVAAAAIAAVAKADTEILVITTSEIDISFLFTEANYHDALIALEEEFQVKE